jgi:hypothetical protein
MLLVSLALVGAGTVAVMIANTANAFPPATLTKIVCNGRICLGTGPREYRWEVTPGNTTAGVTQIDVGAHAGLLVVSNVIAPPGWTYTYVGASGSFPDNTPWTGHGGSATANGNCLQVMRWSGPLQSAPFVIAFNANNTPPHDATWVDSNGTSSTFLRPVGNGQGPIHSPILVGP